MVEGTVGVPVALLEDVGKSLSCPSSSMVVEEGVLVGSSVGVLLCNVLLVAEGFLAWLGLLDPSRCLSYHVGVLKHFRVVQLVLLRLIG